MKRSAFASSVAACICVGLAGPVLAAEAANPPPAAAAPAAKQASQHANQHARKIAAIKPAQKCLSDLRAFNGKMGKSGYWLGGSGNGYGYPMGGFGYGYGRPVLGAAVVHPVAEHPAVAEHSAAVEHPAAGAAADSTVGFRNARPGYEVRTLLASANILAQNGQERSCEDVLATTRVIYKRYAADMHKSGVHRADVPGWRKHEIAAAQPVTSKDTSFRSDELIGTEVRDPKNQSLGSVEDMVMSPKSGKIAYLVIGRGGIFGIDEKYVPVPWDDFKTAPNVNLLVLDTTKDVLDAAPQVNDDKFATASHFGRQSEKVNAYWKTHLSSSKSSTGSNG